MTKRIVVTGIGATSAIGGTAAENWTNLLAGQSGTRTLEHDWVQRLSERTRNAGGKVLLHLRVPRETIAEAEAARAIAHH